MNKEIVEGNKIIAVFDGYEYIPFNNLYNKKAGWWKRGKRPPHYIIYDLFLGRSHNDLNYHADWNRLMRVIDDLNYNYSIIYSGDEKYTCTINLEEDELISSSNESLIDAVWQTVVKFIKFKNEKQ